MELTRFVSFIFIFTFACSVFIHTNTKVNFIDKEQFKYKTAPKNKNNKAVISAEVVHCQPTSLPS